MTILTYNSPGDQQGLAFIVDICKPDSASRGNHYLVPRVATNCQPSEGLALLCMQGAFSLPDEGVCKALLRCYFHYVHPFLPIVNTDDFFAKYLRGDLQKLNPLLLWSMLFAASNVGCMFTYIVLSNTFSLPIATFVRLQVILHVRQ